MALREGTDVQKQAFLVGEANAYARRNRGAGPPSGELIESIARHLPPEGNFLEIGCGDGRILRALKSRLGDSWRLYGLDPSPEAVQELAAAEPLIAAKIGTADDVPYAGPFDAVLLGFFLYVVDRSLLFRVASEVDRILGDGAEMQPTRLFIHDFDPPYPVMNDYLHQSGLRSWKMDYSQLFLANPGYRLRDRVRLVEGERPTDSVSLWVIERTLDAGYSPDS